MNRKYYQTCLLTVILVFYTEFIMAQTVPGDFVHQNTISTSLDAPSRMAIDVYGNVFVTDAYAKAIKKFNASGNYLGTLPYTGVPLSIAISDNNTIFIGDAENSKITRITPDGYQTIIYDALIFPSDMVTAPDNLLYVVDGILNTVIVMDFGGNIIRTIGSGTLLAPRCVAYDRQNKRIIVSEHGGVGNGFNLHAEIRIFDLTGNLISTFGGYGNGNGKFYRIQGLTIGRCGNIYASDNFQGMISVFNSNGVFITRFGQFGLQSGELNAPLDVEFDAQQKLWISSMNNGALEVYSISDSLPSATIPNISKTICTGDSTSIPITFTGKPPFTFTYTVNGLNPTTITNTSSNPYLLTTSMAGSYNITTLSDSVATATCFSGTTDVIINPAPTASITNTTASICSGNTYDIPVNFTGSKPFSFTYAIDSANPVTINNIYSNSYTIPASTAGTYSITALSGGGCIGIGFTGNAIISMNQSPTAAISNINANICAGQSTIIPVTFTGTAPWSFTYTVDGQNPIIVSNIFDSIYQLNVSSSGIYQISAVMDANCSSGTFSGRTTIISNPLPTAAIVSTDTTICNGETLNITVKFTGTGPWDFSCSIDTTIYQIFSGIIDSNFSFPVSQGGTYKLNSVSNSECVGTILPGNVIITVIPNPQAGFGYSINNTEVTFTNTSINADTYLWDFGDGQTSNLADPIHLYSLTGLYYVSLTASNPYCSAVTINDTIDILLTGIASNPQESSFKIYPNPSKGTMNIEINNPSGNIIKLEVIDMTGQLVYSEILKSSVIRKMLDLSVLANGIYTFRLLSAQDIKTQKFIMVRN